MIRFRCKRNPTPTNKKEGTIINNCSFCDLVQGAEVVGRSRVDGSDIIKIPSYIEISRDIREKFDISLIQNLSDGTSYLFNKETGISDYFLIKVIDKR